MLTENRVRLAMRCVYIARSVLVGHSCLPRFARKDFLITYLWVDAAKDRDNYKRYYEYYQTQMSEQNNRLK